MLDQHRRRHRPFQHVEGRGFHDGGGPHRDPRCPHRLQDALRRGISAAGLAEHIGAPPGGGGPAAARRRIGVQAHKQVQPPDVVGDLAPLGQAHRLAAGAGHRHGHTVPLQDGLDPVPHVQGELVLIVGAVRALVGQVACVVAGVKHHGLFLAHRCFLRFSVVQVQQDQVLAGVLSLDQHICAPHIQVDLAAAVHHHGELTALAHHVVPQVLRRHGAAGAVRGPVGDPGILRQPHGHPAPPAAHVIVVVQLLLGPSRPDQQAVCHVVPAVAFPARRDQDGEHIGSHVPAQGPVAVLLIRKQDGPVRLHRAHRRPFGGAVKHPRHGKVRLLPLHDLRERQLLRVPVDHCPQDLLQRRPLNMDHISPPRSPSRPPAYLPGRPASPSVRRRCPRRPTPGSQWRRAPHSPPRRWGFCN